MTKYILKTEPTQMAEWRNLVIEAQQRVRLQLNESLENYVVMTLDAFTTNPELSSSVIALNFLKNIPVETVKNGQEIRTIGDQCLILSGLFPERVRRKNVSQDYFTHIGKEAYHVLSITNVPWQLDNKLFFQLCESFIQLIELLQAMRVKAGVVH